MIGHHTGGLRIDSCGSHVERGGGYRREYRRNPVSDKGWSQRLLVSGIKEAADRIVQIPKNPGLKESLGKEGRETVRKRFLLTRLVEENLDIYSSFETDYRLR
jgi:glycosyltransferase involved in cell wall biosynthesis